MRVVQPNTLSFWISKHILGQLWQPISCLKLFLQHRHCGSTESQGFIQRNLFCTTLRNQNLQFVEVPVLALVEAKQNPMQPVTFTMSDAALIFSSGIGPRSRVQVCGDDQCLEKVRIYHFTEVLGQRKASHLTGKGISQSSLQILFASDKACFAKQTYGDAKRICAANGGRLCTQVEIQSGATRGTGCNFDHDLVWTSTESTNGKKLMNSSRMCCAYVRRSATVAISYMPFASFYRQHDHPLPYCRLVLQWEDNPECCSSVLFFSFAHCDDLNFYSQWHGLECHYESLQLGYR